MMTAVLARIFLARRRSWVTRRQVGQGVTPRRRRVVKRLGRIPRSLRAAHGCPRRCRNREHRRNPASGPPLRKGEGGIASGTRPELSPGPAQTSTNPPTSPGAAAQPPALSSPQRQERTWAGGSEIRRSDAASSAAAPSCTGRAEVVIPVPGCRRRPRSAPEGEAVEHSR